MKCVAIRIFCTWSGTDYEDNVLIETSMNTSYQYLLKYDEDFPMIHIKITKRLSRSARLLKCCQILNIQQGALKIRNLV